MPMNPLEAHVDEVLLQRMRRGDEVAFAALATRYWGAVYRIGWNMLPDPSAAGELAEAAMLSALRSAGQSNCDVPFRTALYRQAMSESLVRLHSAPPPDTRSVGALLPRFDAYGRLASADGERFQSGATAFGRLDAGTRIRDTLQNLDPLDRAAFVLREIEQLSADDTAAVLAISPESVRQRTHRALLILMGSLGELHAASRRASLS